MSFRIGGVLLVDVLNPFRWKAWLQSKWIDIFGKNIKEVELVSYSEQLLYRISKCPRCVENGRCIGYDTDGCGCNTLGKMYIESEKCHENRWGEMLPMEDWNEHKKNHNILVAVIEP